MASLNIDGSGLSGVINWTRDGRRANLANPQNQV
jgi:hypothetical protein